MRFLSSSLRSNLGLTQLLSNCPNLGLTQSPSNFPDESVFQQKGTLFHGISGCNLVIIKSILETGIQCRLLNNTFNNRESNIHPDNMISCSFAPKNYDPKSNKYNNRGYYLYSKSISFVVDSSNIMIENLMETHNTPHPVHPGNINLDKITGIVIGDKVRNKLLSEVPIYDGEQVGDPKIFLDRKKQYFWELEHIKSELDKEKQAEIEMLFPSETPEEISRIIENLPKYAEIIFSKLLGIEKPTLLDFVEYFLPSDKKIYDSYGMEVTRRSSVARGVDAHSESEFKSTL
jgi:hypothetical protein